MEQKPRGRGAAFIQKLQEVQGIQCASSSITQETVAPPVPAVVSSGRGRGLNLANQLKAFAAGELPAVPKPRGRAALTQKLLELEQLSRLQIATESKISVSQPTPVPPVETERPLAKPVKYEGTSGSIVPATANYIRLSVDSNKGVFEYDVGFCPEIDSKDIRIKLVNSQLPNIGGVKLFDGGRCLYLPIKLNDNVTKLNAIHPLNESEILVQLTYKRQNRLGECVHLFNILFKRIMRALTYFQFNRNYFDMKSVIMVPLHKLEVLPGYVLSVDEFEGGLMLCLDAHHRVLRTQTIRDLLIELRMATRERFKTEATNMIIGSVVLTRYNNKTYRIDDIMWDATPSDTFETNSGQKISFIDYYKNQHGLKIADTKQPLLLHRKSIKISGKSEKEDKIVCLVPELCHLTGLTDAMRSDFRVMKDVTQFTCLTPAQRMKSLKTFVDNVHNSAQASKILDEWGLKITDATIDLNIRILTSETIYFGGGDSYKCDGKVDWTSSCSRYKVTGPVDLCDWVIVFVEKDRMNVKEFCETIARLGPGMGCNIQKPQLYPLKSDRTTAFVEACNNVIRETTQCIVIISPSMRADLYTSVKKICCLKSPVASQVILSRTLGNKKRFRNIVQKIALQINCKLGGSLWTLNIPVKNWMICGIDTYHSKGSTPSVCGFVASLNETFSRWYSIAFQQQKEIADHLKVTFVKTLEKYREISGTFPAVVVIFRDGVGDGQLKSCLDYEVQQFLDCIKQLQIDVKLCVVIVQKRINTRIFLNKNGGVDNAPPGSVLDHSVTRYNYQDFFLVSQHSNQGTVSPTHYIVLYDNANLKVDHVQKLSYKLCHLYYNWSGTIRVPAPCQYAHKLAYFVGQNLGKSPPECLATRLYFL